MKSTHLFWNIGVMALIALSSYGCASARSGKTAESSPSDSKVMYTPPLEDKVVVIPAGAPVLPEYEKRVEEPTQLTANTSATAIEDDGTITRPQLDTILARGPGWGLAQVEVSPVKEGGALRGYAIRKFSPAASRTLANQLRVGDVITHLNGVKLERPDDFMKAWNKSREVEAIRFDYLRGEVAQYASWDVVDP